jgi:hypothetical protein
MANRYWVGTTGNWTDASNWSTTEGGSGGASVPTLSDVVYLGSTADVFLTGTTYAVDAVLESSIEVSAGIVTQQQLNTTVELSDEIQIVQSISGEVDLTSTILLAKAQTLDAEVGVTATVISDTRYLLTADAGIASTVAVTGAHAKRSTGDILLLNFEDGNGSTTFLDEGSGYVPSLQDGCIVTTNYSAFGTGSLLIPNNDAIEYSNLTLPSNDIIVECSVRFPSDFPSSDYFYVELGGYNTWAWIQFRVYYNEFWMQTYARETVDLNIYTASIDNLSPVSLEVFHTLKIVISGRTLVMLWNGEELYSTTANGDNPFSGLDYIVLHNDDTPDGIWVDHLSIVGDTIVTADVLDGTVSLGSSLQHGEAVLPAQTDVSASLLAVEVLNTDVAVSSILNTSGKALQSTAGILSEINGTVSTEVINADITFDNVSARGYCGAICSIQLDPITASGRTGAVSCSDFPAVVLSGQFKTGAVVTGTIELLPVTASGVTGAICSISFPSISASGELAYITTGNIVLPAITALGLSGAVGEVVLATLTTTGNLILGNTVVGNILLPRLGVVGDAISGTSAAANIQLPLLIISASAEVGSVAFSSVGFPCPHLVGTMTLLPEITSSITLPLLRVKGKFHVPHTYPSQSYNYIRNLFH